MESHDARNETLVRRACRYPTDIVGVGRADPGPGRQRCGRARPPRSGTIPGTYHAPAPTPDDTGARTLYLLR